MKEKSPKQIFLIGVLVVAVILIISNIYYQSTKKEKKANSGKGLNSKTTKEVSYSDLKKQNFYFFEKKSEISEISVVLIEYRYDDYSNALIIRCDSMTSIISSGNTLMENYFLKDSLVANLSINFINYIDSSFYDLPFKENNLKFIVKKKSELSFFVKNNMGEMKILTINSRNYKKEEYQVLLDLFIKLVSRIKDDEISIDEFVK